ncbi:MAG: magnesium/cobalt transporter CorA [Candidatus Cloacimonetes bacterium]|nr:magnesium/cobalt transporter CorA [Candidatus Cloacimonadota bacterium]
MKKKKNNKWHKLFYQGEIGLPPGTPVFVGNRKQENVKIDIINYTKDEFEEINDAELKDCEPHKDSPTTTWINIYGIHDINLIQSMADIFGLHPLTTEDICNASQRPKVEEFEEYLFFAFKMLTYDSDANAINNENVSIVIGRNYVLSFQEHEGDVLDPVRERIRKAKGRIRGERMDYLAYAIMDSVVDEYFLSLEKLGDHIEELDEDILANPDATHMKELHRLKREIVFLRKAVWPLREEISTIEKSESKLISNSIRIYLRDLYDHTIQIIDMVETYRDIVGGMHDTFLSSISNRMNEVMKVLTIIGTIFIPLTFIAGIYGMNFENMPELGWKYGYFGLLGVMLLVGIIMVLFFKKRKWI